MTSHRYELRLSFFVLTLTKQSLFSLQSCDGWRDRFGSIPESFFFTLNGPQHFGSDLAFLSLLLFIGQKSTTSLGWPISSLPLA